MDSIMSASTQGIAGSLRMSSFRPLAYGAVLVHITSRDPPRCGVPGDRNGASHLGLPKVVHHEVQCGQAHRILSTTEKNTDTIWEECQGVSRNVTSTVHWSNHDWEIILVFVLLLLLLLYYYCTINMSIIKDLLPFWQQVLWFQPLLRYNRSIMSIELWPHGVKMSPMASAVTWQSGDHWEWGFVGTLSQAGTSYWGDFHGFSRPTEHSFGLWAWELPSWRAAVSSTISRCHFHAWSCGFPSAFVRWTLKNENLKGFSLFFNHICIDLHVQVSSMSLFLARKTYD